MFIFIYTVFLIIATIITTVLILKKIENEKEFKDYLRKSDRDLEFKKACEHELVEKYGLDIVSCKKFVSDSIEYKDVLYISDDRSYIAYINSNTAERKFHVIRAAEILDVDLCIDRNDKHKKCIHAVRVSITSTRPEIHIDFMLYYREFMVFRATKEVTDIIDKGREIKAELNSLKKHTEKRVDSSFSNEFIYSKIL